MLYSELGNCINYGRHHLDFTQYRVASTGNGMLMANIIKCMKWSMSSTDHGVSLTVFSPG